MDDINIPQGRSIKDQDERTLKLIRRYIKPYGKKMYGKDVDTRCIMASTFNTAIQVLDRIRDVDVAAAVMSVFVYCKDEKYRFISKEFESCLEIAALDPDRFVMGLHKFYNNMAAKIKKPGMRYALFEFISLFRKLQYTKSDNHIDGNIILAYTDLILQMMEYIRPHKLDISVAVAGLSIDGEETLTVPDPNASYVLPAWEVIYRFFAGQPFDVNGVRAVYSHFGFDVKSQADIDVIARTCRIQQNLRAALLPYINEYTYDIFPTNVNNGDIRELYFMSSDLDISALKAALLMRRRTLPTNGVQVRFNDPTEYLFSMLLKEMVNEDQVIMLFRIDTSLGQFAGYFNTATGFLYHSAIESENEKFCKWLSTLPLYFYAVSVLDDSRYTDEASSEHFSNIGYRIPGRSYGSGGKIRDMYHQPCTEAYNPVGPRKGDDRYETREKMVNGYIRRLPEGQKASESAIEKAKKLGYNLAEGETYVSPFSKHVFFLKDKDDTAHGQKPETQDN